MWQERSIAASLFVICRKLKPKFDLFVSVFYRYHLLKVQLIQLATTEVAGDNLSDTEEDEDEEATTYAFDLPFEGSSRSAAFTTMLANAQSKVDELKDCLSSAEVLRVTAMCKLQSARERTSVASENTSSPASGATAAATSD
jgi:hypothetical protein